MKGVGCAGCRDVVEGTADVKGAGGGTSVSLAPELLAVIC